MSGVVRPIITLLLCLAAGSEQKVPRLERVYPLEPNERAFAYARISPNGRTLVYASESTLAVPGRAGNASLQLLKVVDLRSRHVEFTEPGIDGYWSVDGERMIYESTVGRKLSVSIRHENSGAVTRDVAPPELGDYFSWGMRDGRDIVLTIDGRYYYLDGDHAALPAAHIQSCSPTESGERPLMSKDGQRVSVFINGTIVIRNLTDCDGYVDTGISGAKADFSWDGRYVAFHAPKVSGDGYEIEIVDLARRTVRRLKGLAGSSYFPSWTRDGRLCFRYEGPDYRGFMLASDVLSAPEEALSKPDSAKEHSRPLRSWRAIFPETPMPPAELSVVLVWATWSAHSAVALAALQRARDYLTNGRFHPEIDVFTAVEPSSREEDAKQLLKDVGVNLPRIDLRSDRLALTEGTNQMPVTLLFQGGKLADRRLGAQSFEQLVEWIALYSSSLDANAMNAPARVHRARVHRARFALP